MRERIEQEVTVNARTGSTFRRPRPGSGHLARRTRHVGVRPGRGRRPAATATAAARAGQLHRRAGGRGIRRVPAALRRVPRRESGRRSVRAAAPGHRLPRNVAPPLGGGAVPADRRDHAAGPAGHARRRDGDAARRADAAGERRGGERRGPAVRPGPDGGPCTGMELAGRRTLAGRRPAAVAGPVESARRDAAGHRRDAARPAGGRLAAVAADLRRLRFQPARWDRPGQRRRSARRLVVGAAPGPERVDADRARRRALRARLRRPGSRL